MSVEFGVIYSVLAYFNLALNTIKRGSNKIEQMQY